MKSFIFASLFVLSFAAHAQSAGNEIVYSESQGRLIEEPIGSGDYTGQTVNVEVDTSSGGNEVVYSRSEHQFKTIDHEDADRESIGCDQVGDPSNHVSCGDDSSDDSASSAASARHSFKHIGYRHWLRNDGVHCAGTLRHLSCRR